MKVYDQHLHSRHSFDSRAEPRENVLAALAAGLAGLTFTEHFDAHPHDWQECVYNDEAYSAEIRALREEFGDKIFIGKGIEICYQPGRIEFILDFLSRHRFDMVMLSVHYFGDVPVHRRENWDGLSIEDGTRRYLENVREGVRFCERLHATARREIRGGKAAGRVFDVLGHLDLVKRYSQRFLGGYAVAECADIIDDILSAALGAGIVLEINTSSLRQSLDETMPNFDVIRRYATMGGEAVSIGSDAHRSADIGAGFEHALNMVRESGLGRLALFQARERKSVKIDE